MYSQTKITQIAQILETKVPIVDLKIIEFLQQKNKASLDEIVTELARNEETKRSKETVSKRISLLKNEGLIIKFKDGKVTYVKWIGGVPVLENELETATSSHVKASMIAENYDSLVLDPFSIFSVLFENNCWEILMNIKEGLNDVELSQRIGAAIPLDTIRRVLIIGNSHNLLTISMLRNSAGNDVVKIFEPLYRIESINKVIYDYLILLRGLASAMSFKMEQKNSSEHDHLYDSILNSTMNNFYSLKDEVSTTSSINDKDMLNKLLLNYDFAPDMDRLYKHENWRLNLNRSSKLVLDDKTDHLLIKKQLSDSYKKSIAKGK